jgi:hypothetical protein
VLGIYQRYISSKKKLGFCSTDLAAVLPFNKEHYLPHSTYRHCLFPTRLTKLLITTKHTPLHISSCHPLEVLRYQRITTGLSLPYTNKVEQQDSRARHVNCFLPRWQSGELLTHDCISCDRPFAVLKAFIAHYEVIIVRYCYMALELLRQAITHLFTCACKLETPHRISASVSGRPVKRLSGFKSRPANAI